MTVMPVATARFRPNPLRIGLLRGGLELKQFSRGRESVIFSFMFPILLLVIFGAIFNFNIAPGVKFTQYFVTGMIATGLMTAGFQALAIQIPMERDRGVLKRFRGTPMPRWVYFAGKVLMVAFIAVLETAILLTVSTLLFGLDLPDTGAKWLTFLWVAALSITACTLCGVAFSSVARTGRSAPAVVTPVALILQFISGVFFVFAVLPQWMQTIAAFFPLKWMTQGMRSVFLPDAYQSQEPAGSWEHGRIAIVLGLWLVGGLLVAVRTFRWRNKADG